ncbi:hypothetical protein MMC25_002277 [Agyrium rufum]|nr:hypothetical protein [Agyrium rufum]
MVCRDMFEKVCSIERSLQVQETDRKSLVSAGVRTAISSWLDPADSHRKYIRALKGLQEGTGTWFLDSILQDLLDSQDPVPLWLKAKPGFGKTTLMAAGIHKVSKLPQEVMETQLIYHFCSFTDQKSRGLINVSGSLVVQLCGTNPVLWELVDQRLKWSNSQAPHLFDKPKSSDLMDLLACLAEKVSSVTLFVDAVNEAKEPGALLDCLVSLANRTKSIRVILSSTEETAAQFVYLERGELDLSARVDFVPLKDNLHANDISIYIEAEIEKRQKLCHLSPTLKEEILTVLNRGAEGVLEQTYERILVRMVENSQADLGRPALFWLCFAWRPMTLEELCEAIIIPEEGGEIDDEDRLQWPQELLQTYGSLICVRSSSYGSALTLAHSSVSAYLTSSKLNDSCVSDFYMDPQTAHHIVCKLCLNYLLSPMFSSGPCSTKEALDWRLGQCSMLEYTKDHLWDHLYNVDPAGPLRSLILQFLDSHQLPRGGHFAAWVQVYYGVEHMQFLSGTTGLYFASRQGLLPLVRLILTVQGSRNLEKKGGRRGSTPLHVAATAGHLSIVRELLDAGADINERNDKGENGLFWATLENYSKIQAVLRTSGATLDEEMMLILQRWRHLEAMRHESSRAVRTATDADMEITTRKRSLEQSHFEYWTDKLNLDDGI